MATQAKEMDRRKHWKRRALQLLIFSLALLRFYLIGMVAVNSQVNAITRTADDNSNLWTLCFSFTLFGQVIDNITRVKLFFVACELAFALWAFLLGAVNMSDQAVFEREGTI